MSENHYRRIKTIKVSNTNKFHLIHIISGSLDISEGKSDQSEDYRIQKWKGKWTRGSLDPGIGWH